MSDIFMINPTTDTAIPRVADINDSDTGRIRDCARSLLKLYQQEGGFNHPRRSTTRLRAIEAELTQWCDIVKRLLMNAPLSDIAILINTYDLPHRIARGQAPSREFMRKVRLAAVDRWVKGDKSITSTTIVQLLRDEIHSPGYKNLDSKYSRFYFGTINDWVNELERLGAFEDITLHEARQRLHILMAEDLFAEYGTEAAARAAKQRWAAGYSIDTPRPLNPSAPQSPLKKYVS